MILGFTVATYLAGYRLSYDSIIADNKRSSFEGFARSRRSGPGACSKRADPHFRVLALILALATRVFMFFYSPQSIFLTV